MNNERFRYFLELQPNFSDETPRRLENTLRRQHAENFIMILEDWLEENHLTDKVSSLSVTAFGQVQITCENEVMQLMREEDVLNIAAIRQSGFQSADFAKLMEPRRVS